MICWLNGAFKEEATISIRDRGLLLGDGLFETFYVENSRPAFLSAHLARLRVGMKALAMDVPLPDNLSALIASLTEKNHLGGGAASARLTVTRGVSDRGLVLPEAPAPTVILTIAPAAPHECEPHVPLALQVSEHIRAEKSITARHKTICYLDQLLARNDALAAGADDAIMLNGFGRIACASSANLFAIDKQGKLFTPPAAEGALPGIVRDLLLRGAGEVKVESAERALTLDDLADCALFLTNSLIGLRAARLKRQGAPNSDQREIFNRLNAWYQDRLRRDIAERPVIT